MPPFFDYRYTDFEVEYEDYIMEHIFSGVGGAKDALGLPTLKVHRFGTTCWINIGMMPGCVR